MSDNQQPGDSRHQNSAASHSEEGGMVLKAQEKTKNMILTEQKDNSILHFGWTMCIHLRNVRAENMIGIKRATKRRFPAVFFPD